MNDSNRLFGNKSQQITLQNFCLCCKTPWGGLQVYGIEAINEANGWNLTVLAISVVFISLIILSLIISQLHRILSIWDKRTKLVPQNLAPEKKDAADTPREHAGNGKVLASSKPASPEDINEMAAKWSPLIEKLDDPFLLADLHKLAAENDFPHPHLTISQLRYEHILVPAENQRFTFKYERGGKPDIR
jgi:Na+-transporting methylmalonyl-CoA/oxaloacetate decarboxylase gamma subunit